MASTTIIELICDRCGASNRNGADVEKHRLRVDGRAPVDIELDAQCFEPIKEFLGAGRRVR